jgi:hypothetical protein
MSKFPPANSHRSWRKLTPHYRLKCDREHPCQNCVKRGLSCAYATTSDSSQRLAQNDLPPATPAPASLHGHIVELETLVISLKNGPNAGSHIVNQARNVKPNVTDVLQMSNEHDTDGDSISRDPPQPSDKLKRISLENAGTSYVESAHRAQSWKKDLDAKSLVYLSEC